LHALAIASSPDYLTGCGPLLTRDFPRIPLPADAKTLADSAALGAELAALLDAEVPVAGVTTGAVDPLLRIVAPVTRVGGGHLDPGIDLRVDAAWGYEDKTHKVMPGPGTVMEREYNDDERAILSKAAAERGSELSDLTALIGETTFDVFLNDNAYWSGVPAKVWQYAVTRNRVLKKWLSYREESVLGRALSADETREFTGSARRITAVLLLGPRLDRSFESVAAQVRYLVPS
jgi:hypothetical protein